MDRDDQGVAEGELTERGAMRIADLWMIENAYECFDLTQDGRRFVLQSLPEGAPLPTAAEVDRRRHKEPRPRKE